ncbi:putative beta-lactamase-like 1 [Dysidea avara]|uniref:putative beta-lactamase-like 1 n=1 Tax=Dysidea avara TaxID=196820 RepID=UPI003316D372
MNTKRSIRSLSLLLICFLMSGCHWGLSESFNLRSVLDNEKVTDPLPKFCPIHPEPLPLPSPLPDPITDALTNLSSHIKLLIDELSAPGLAAAVAYRGETILTVGEGVINKKSTPARKPDSDTIFRIGSISKVFVIITLFQLLEKGHVKSLDEPISNYCLSFSIKNPYKIDNVVTLRQMASQLSGLPDQPPCLGDFVNNACPATTQEIVSRLKDQYLVSPSWTRPSYSNLAYALLGRCLIQKLSSSTTYEKYVEKNIIEPLNMTSTGFEYTDSVKARTATGYDAGGYEVSLYDLGWAAPAGQMYSTVNDMMKLAQFFNSFGQGYGILSPDYVKQMLLPAFIDYDGVTVWGTPWEMAFLDSYLVRSKGGIITGYSGLMTFLPELQLSYIILISGQIPLTGVLSYPYDLLINAFVPVLSNMQPNYPAPHNPEAYIGVYHDKAGQFNYTVFQYENQLALQITPTVAVFLSYYDDLLFQAKLPPVLPCVLYEISAANNQWVYFDKIDEQTGKSPGFTFPGIPGLISREVKSTFQSIVGDTDVTRTISKLQKVACTSKLSQDHVPDCDDSINTCAQLVQWSGRDGFFQSCQYPLLRVALWEMFDSAHDRECLLVDGRVSPNTDLDGKASPASNLVGSASLVSNLNERASPNTDLDGRASSASDLVGRVSSWRFAWESVS